MPYKRYWVALAIVIIGSFVVLGGVGRKMISEAPPIPDVYSADGQLLFTGSSITDGQGVWQSIGGQEIGTVWGHGAYVAPDWSADWLHRESEILLNTWAVRAGATNFDALGLDQQAIFKARLIREMRTNTYDASRNRVTLSADRTAAFEQLRAYYTDVFATGRSEYAIPGGALTNAAKQHKLTAFFWWTAWACGTDRPGSDTTYTSNWPHETPLKLSFWSLNFGLIFMVILSMLPVGLLQAWASIERGTWYARSAEFMQSGSMQTLRWMRVPGDILFSIGAALFAWFVLGLLTGHSYNKEGSDKADKSLRDESEEHFVALAGR